MYSKTKIKKVLAKKKISQINFARGLYIRFREFDICYVTVYKVETQDMFKLQCLNADYNSRRLTCYCLEFRLKNEDKGDLVFSVSLKFFFLNQ